jgi:glycosyltransferase involved in cell wall biosynthesis/2-polyprenyl-3-methyl-5-hydroxy-6-metoxy-1,4-benzoquinol methylase
MYYAFSVVEYRLLGCQDCGYLTMFPQPSDEDLAKIYGENYTLMQASQRAKVHFAALKQMTARKYLNLIGRYRGRSSGHLIEIGCGSGDLLAVASSMGYQVTGVEYSPHSCAEARERLDGQGEIIQGQIGAVADRAGSYDVCVLSDVIEHVRDPRSFLNQIYELLVPGGVVFIATPTLDSWSAKFMKNNWMEFKAEHLHYFDQNTLHSLLFQCGFERTVPSKGVKTLSLTYVLDHFEKYPVGKIGSFLKFLSQILPAQLRNRPVNIVASGMIALASKGPRHAPRKLSIVLPAYNEAGTLQQVLDGVLAHDFGGIDREVVLVESNSTDGTREIARKYQNHSEVRLILEDRPRGKGFAVRTGLANATGDFILIQDADLEYDLEDYDVLLEPLVTGRKAFVLGARHGGKILKLRSFQGNRLTSGLLNMGHWFFKTLVNVLFRVKLGDPFTMYKVFRRDCLSGLKLECNRFDLDFELVIKLVRKGYIPMEIPVNYRSRSFSEGKKVSMLRDPLTWFRALVKFRLQRLDLFQALDTNSTMNPDQAGEPQPARLIR